MAFSAIVVTLRLRSAVAVAAVCLSIWLIACASGVPPPEACADDDRELRLGFYAYFAPVSHSADGEEGSPGFDVHQGYEADLLTALEAMDGVRVSFSRRGIGSWDDIWLASVGPEFDVIGGGITVLGSRTRDAQGREAVVFTSGHIAFRQSLLVRAEDESRFTDYNDVTSDVQVGALAGTTGEARLLELTGLTNSNGALVAGAIIETPRGEVVADGASNYRITAAGASENLAGRRRIRPSADNMPEVVYFGNQLGETELLAALSDGRIDALARGEVGNREAEHASGDAFVVALLDDAVERGGFTFDVADAALAACLSDRIDFLTDEMTVGYADWLQDPSVFMRRAEIWNGRQ
ncbi:MAG: transporter substrate-binding domain-containing protein [Chloroflexi bacterium]|nr:transporter substrate-binding domain-containing protein [Chloroflexota bacterium]